MKVIKESSGAAAQAAAFLKKGGVIICPTDTVYGFLADAQNKKAVEKIYKIKKRSKLKPLSIFVANMKMAKEIAMIDKNQAKILKEFWPGKYTFILKRKKIDVGRLYALLDGIKKDTIAIRIPNHPFLLTLLKKIDKTLVQTSVNISNQDPLKSIEQIIATFGKNHFVGLIIDGGDVKEAKSSKVIDLTRWPLTIIR